ncbi:MAG: hypothetical protein AAF530_18380 [Pseudomonadota bacterium]
MSWTLPDHDDDLMALATGYPFSAPGHSYLYQDGDFARLENPDPELFEKRMPVIGHGSNRSPDQLRRKFDYLTGAASQIPVTRAMIADYDVVYSAHVTQYGAIAANLQHAPGAQVEVYVTWLNGPQLKRMHDTELGGENYFYGRLDDISLSLEAGPSDQLDQAYVYLSTRGCLAQEAEAVALAAVPASRRPHRALAQAEVLTFVRDRYRPGPNLRDHALRTIRDPRFRQTLVAEMEGDSVPALAPHFTILERP